MNISEYKHRLTNFTPGDFDELAMYAFRYQQASNPVYSEFLDLLSIDRNSVTNPAEIPFLPISAFKHHRVISGACSPQISFTSSGTTGIQSVHHICDISLYEWSFLKCFENFYGDVKDWTILALLPSYLDRSGSSLVYMTDRLISLSKDTRSGFYLNQYETLSAMLKELKNESGRKVMLLGVSFALLELAERFPSDLSGITIIETGGMKGRRKEITRGELHQALTEAFNVSSVHSEYGMTELLSQAWSQGKGLFNAPPWMNITIRDLNDPMQPANRERGGINITDLANINSCCFIATDDMGMVNSDGSFSVTGRVEYSDLRGCNLMVSL